MPWDGSGNFTRGNGVNSGATTWQDDASSVEDILADRHDTHDEDLADGIHACLAKNGENAATADLDIGSNKLTNVAAGTASTDAATIGGSETLTNKTLTSPTIQGGTIGSSTVMDSAKITEINQYTTSTVSTTNYGRIARIELTAQNYDCSLLIRVMDTNGQGNAEFSVFTRQIAALNDDPVCYIRCEQINNTSSDFSSNIAVTSLSAFYTISETESYIDIYINTGSGSASYMFQPIIVRGNDGTNVIVSFFNNESVDTEANITGGSFDVTSEAAPGVIEYNAAIDIVSGNITSNSGGNIFIATRVNGGYKCELFITGACGHSSASQPSSNTAAIPDSKYYPDSNAYNLYRHDGSTDKQIIVTTSGAVAFEYRDDTGALTANTSTSVSSSVSWNTSD